MHKHLSTLKRSRGLYLVGNLIFTADFVPLRLLSDEELDRARHLFAPLTLAETREFMRSFLPECRAAIREGLLNA